MEETNRGTLEQDAQLVPVDFPRCDDTSTEDYETDGADAEYSSDDDSASEVMQPALQPTFGGVSTEVLDPDRPPVFHCDSSDYAEEVLSEAFRSSDSNLVY